MPVTNPDDVMAMAMDTRIDGDHEPPPDGGYGWVCVAACFIINCFTWGIVSVSQNVWEVLQTLYDRRCIVLRGVSLLLSPVRLLLWS